MYVYIQTEPSLWTVGFYDPTGEFQPESDHSNTESAAQRVNWLNGANDLGSLAEAVCTCNPIDRQKNDGEHLAECKSHYLA